MNEKSETFKRNGPYLLAGALTVFAIGAAIVNDNDNRTKFDILEPATVVEVGVNPKDDNVEPFVRLEQCDSSISIEAAEQDQRCAYLSIELSSLRDSTVKGLAVGNSVIVEQILI